MRLAVIIPIHNRAQTIEESLRALTDLRRRGHRVVVVDGGSSDDSTVRASRLADRVVAAPLGWSLQMNAGSRSPEAEIADVLVFLPEAVRLPAQADRAIVRALSNSTSPWGRFDVSFRHPRDGTSLPLQVAAALANWCSRATGICTQEQAIFVTRSAFLALEGFSATDGSADAEFSRRAGQLGPPIALRERALVCATEPGIPALLRSILRRERLRLACALGVDPAARGQFFRRES